MKLGESYKKVKCEQNVGLSVIGFAVYYLIYLWILFIGAYDR